MPCISEYMNGKHECNLLIFVFVLSFSLQPFRDTCPAHTPLHTHEMNCQPNATSSSFLTLVHLLLLRFRRNVCSLRFFLLLLFFPNWTLPFMDSMLCWQCVTFAWFHINSFKSNEISEMHCQRNDHNQLGATNEEREKRDEVQRNVKNQTQHF